MASGDVRQHSVDDRNGRIAREFALCASVSLVLAGDAAGLDAQASPTHRTRLVQDVVGDWGAAMFGCLVAGNGWGFIYVITHRSVATSSA